MDLQNLSLSAESLANTVEFQTLEPEAQLAIDVDFLTKQQEQLVLEYKEQLSKTNQTIAALLSATEQFKRKYDSQLSAANPYEKLKAQYLDSSRPIISVDELAFPSTFSASTAMAEITSISVASHEHFMTQLHYLTGGQMEAASTMYTVLCGDEFVVDKEKMRAHFEFLELVRNMSVEQINSNPLTVAIKLVTEFIRTYK